MMQRLAVLAVVSAFPCANGISISQKVLPEVKDVMKGPKNVFSMLHSQMNKLSQKLGEEQLKSNKVVADMKAAFEKNLTKETKHNDDISKANVGLEADINGLQADIKKLRSDDNELRQENRDLVADLHVMQNNVTTVIEFAASALNQSHEMLEVAPELQVLTELATKDEVSKKDRDHKKRLMNVARGKSVSLLQVASLSFSQDPGGVLDSMNEALTQLENEENASKTNMTASFDRDFKVLMGSRAELLQEQEQLNTTKTNAIELKEKLTTAMEHLTVAHKKLNGQEKSLRKFSQKLADRPLPKSPLSLLQSNAEIHGKKVLPGVATVMSKPKAIFSKMNTHVNSLEGRLAEVQTQNLDEISKQKHQYEVNLTKQKDKHVKMERFNKAVKLDVQHLHTSISRLRSSASDLEKLNAVLVADLKKVQANITTAEEFTVQALNSSEDMLYNAPEIAVLAELAQKDEAMGSVNDHHKRLKEIGDATSLLQFSKGADPKKLLELMTTALTELSQEQGASEISLRESFLAEYAGGEMKTELLLKQQEELNATKEAAIELQDQLAEAVEHLQNSHRQLKERSSSLHAFAAKLGLKAMPKLKAKALSLLQVNSNSNLRGVDVKEVLKKPKSIFNSMTQNVSALGSTLAAAQSQATDDLMAQKDEYDKELDEAKRENQKIELKNDKIERHVKVVKAEVSQLRHKSDMIKKENKVLREELVYIQANMTLAQEFLTKSLEKTNESDETAEELFVLHELSEEDKVSAAEAAHSSSLAKIHVKGKSSKNSKSSLLQLKSNFAKLPRHSKRDKSLNSSNPEGANTILASLESSLQTMIAEQEASKQELNEQFETEMASYENQTAELLQIQEGLNLTDNTTMILRDRLKIAITHLQKTTEVLKKRNKGMKKFAEKLAARPNPTASLNLLETEGQTAAAAKTASKKAEAPASWLKDSFLKFGSSWR